MKRVNSSSADGSSSKPKRIYKLRNNSKQTSIDTNVPINNKITRSAAAAAAGFATADREQPTKKVLDELNNSYNNSNNNNNNKNSKATNLLNTNRSSKRLITRRSLVVAAAAHSNKPTDPHPRSLQTNNVRKKSSAKSTTTSIVITKGTRATKSKAPSSTTLTANSRNVDNRNKLEVMGNINNNNNDNNAKNETKTVFKTMPHSDLVVNDGPEQNETSNDNNDDLDHDDDDVNDDGTKTKSNVAKKRTPRTKRKYICHFCNKQFFGGNDLRKHIRIHTDERPFECQHCGQKFRQGGCLKNHIASQHGTSEVFTCAYCNKQFPIKERLRLHMRLHSGEKPYQCKICLKRFARGGQLKQHLASHSGIKKYHCDQCSASFSCSVNLKLHLKSHSNVRDFTCHLCSNRSFLRLDGLKKHLSCYHDNVKAFFCNICSRTFKGHLPQHMRTHENLKTHGCAICLSRFSQKSQLIVHQRIHSGERPYRCQVCWQAFAHSSVLKLHIRKHTGEKPFKCVLCKDTETAFSQLPHLKTHMRAIHGMDKAYNCDTCTEYFKTKQELQEHKFTCPKAPRTPGQEPNENFPVHVVIEPKCSSKESTLSRMRLLIAVLLKKISSPDKLKQLGFDKRLIDNVLMDALKMAGQIVCTDTKLHEVDRLKKNVDIFLEFTIPESYMKKIRTEKRSTEELLEDLTSNFNREPTKKS